MGGVGGGVRKDFPYPDYTASVPIAFLYPPTRKQEAGITSTEVRPDRRSVQQ